MSDRRYEIVRERLESLSSAQLREIQESEDLLLFDEFNFKDGRFCPLAVGLGCHRMQNPSQESVVAVISQSYSPANALKGVPGNFYHGDDKSRKSDLMGLVDEILLERKVL